MRTAGRRVGAVGSPSNRRLRRQRLESDGYPERRVDPSILAIISTCVTESRMKTAVKTPARKTNNQASFGGSILKNNMEVEAAMELQRHLDETGVHQVHTIYA